jgi:hypothetical protein
VHLTLGILRTSQAVFYALAFFWLDGFAVPAPAQVTQTVSQPKSKTKYVFDSQVSFLAKVFFSAWLFSVHKVSSFLAVALFQIANLVNIFSASRSSSSRRFLLAAFSLLA